MDKHYTLVSCPYCHLVYSKDGHYDNMEMYVIRKACGSTSFLKTTSSRLEKTDGYQICCRYRPIYQ